MIVIIDLGISNLGSVVRALNHITAQCQVTADADVIDQARALILPGVGAFGDGMTQLRERELAEPIKRFAASGRPLLGICLGMQLLASDSEEGGVNEGLGLIPAKVRKLDAGDSGERVPNIGWCDLTPRADSGLFVSGERESCYFVHSYHMVCDDQSDVAATILFAGDDVTAAVHRDNIYGAQFHPEKSQDAGLDMLQKFVDLIE